MPAGDRFTSAGQLLVVNAVGIDELSENTRQPGGRHDRQDDAVVVRQLVNNEDRAEHAVRGAGYDRSHTDNGIHARIRAEFRDQQVASDSERCAERCPDEQRWREDATGSAAA